MTKTQILEELAFIDHLSPQEQQAPAQEPSKKGNAFSELDYDLKLSNSVAELCNRAAHMLSKIVDLSAEPLALEVFRQQCTALSYRFRQLANKCPTSDPRPLVETLVAQKKSSREIAQALNDHGYTSRRGASWSHSLVCYAFKDILEKKNQGSYQTPLQARAKELRTRGLTLHQIAEKLNEEGYTGVKGNTINYTKVFQLLRKA